jgi:hypothetical protein
LEHFTHHDDDGDRSKQVLDLANGNSEGPSRLLLLLLLLLLCAVHEE